MIYYVVYHSSQTNLITVRVNGSLLLKVLTRGLASIHTGMFISYTGLEYDANQQENGFFNLLDNHLKMNNLHY